MKKCLLFSFFKSTNNSANETGLCFRKVTTNGYFLFDITTNQTYPTSNISDTLKLSELSKSSSSISSINFFIALSTFNLWKVPQDLSRENIPKENTPAYVLCLENRNDKGKIDFAVFASPIYFPLLSNDHFVCVR